MKSWYEDDQVEIDDRRFIWIGAVVAAVCTALAIIGIVAAVNAQTSPVFGLCGYAKVMTPTSAQLASGTAMQSLSVGTTAVSPTIPVMASGSTGGPVIGATVQIKNGLVNFRVDGTAATATTGDTIGPGGSSISANAPYFEVCGSDLRKISLIQGTGSATAAETNWRYYIPGS